jgi:phosphohistidine swiveling domain-containing protein
MQERTIDENKKLLDQVGIMKTELWEEDGRWITPVLPWMFFTHWYKSALVKKLYPTQKLHTIFSVHGYAFWNVESRKIIYADLECRFKNGTLQELVDMVDEDARAIFSAVSAELAHDDVYIQKNVVTIFNLYKEFIGTWTMATALGDQMVLLAKNMGQITSDAELFAKVHPHLRATWIEHEVERMVHIAQLSLANAPEQEIAPLIDSYLKEFVWCRISKWIGEPIDREYANKRLAEEIENYKQGNHSKTKRSEETDRSLEGIIATSVCSAYWRAQSAMIEMSMALRMRPILNEIAEKNSCTYRQIVDLTPEELIAAIQHPDKQLSVSSEIIGAREHEFFNTVTDDGVEVVLTTLDQEYAVIKNIYIKKADDSHVKSGILKGIGASLGKVTGSVRVISSSKEFGDFKLGEILVAAETSPTFVPLMRMSAAILTGKGGITSHAAIVSRELGKPCIIAIKDVTKILKNGDIVEVDADKGIIKFLSK